ncbi:aspartyl/glutamyl-tRNA(Asn/Gln) amidotransferase A subunit [Aeriscardovia aeriphila]|uniref:Glutamyl-tRNA(Gln) amidotransferase subunit A n=1 Tax=Aeriscardovia aeriphila TaxID=218139 RepID=A0A261FBR1_9BIFI|nr:aspartyl/glutamyl-tRNA(Asn/Gln) amidotransferase A subunit [Aeriscardovia aeriphila]
MSERMNDAQLVKLTAAQMADKLKAGEVTSRELVQAHINVIAAAEPELKAFLSVSATEALKTADEVDRRRAAGEELPEMAGVPVAIKDMIVTKGIETTAASRILQGWIPPYDATVVEKLKANLMPILGKTNLDEFAQGSSTEHSAYFPTHNPWDTERVPGGSGGGSACAVAAYEAPLALGTDTGGSIRQPGAFTGTVGVKPTYGGVSRFGAIAMASSLDQIGPVARTVLDAALLHEVIGGYDERDSTSIPEPTPAVVKAAREGQKMDLSGLKVGVVKELSGKGYEDVVSHNFEHAVELLKSMGAQVSEVSLPNASYAMPSYYVLMPSEVSSNLARYDGMRYGLRMMPPADVAQTSANMMAYTREAGFGSEVKRRILLGTYALSAGFYDKWYGSAQKVRTLIIRDFEKAFEKVDVLVSPASPTTAFKLGEELTDPMTMYLNDVATIPANLAGIPAMSLPMGLGNGLPTGFQIMAPAKHDDMMYKPAAALEAAFAKEAGEASELPTSKWADQAAQNADVSSAEADKINQVEKAEAVDAALKAFPGVRVTKAEEK